MNPARGSLPAHRQRRSRRRRRDAHSQRGCEHVVPGPHDVLKKESGGQGLAIMWPLFIPNKQQPTENCCRRSGGLWRGNGNEVEHVGRMLPNRFGHKLSDKKLRNKNTLWPKRLTDKQKYMTTNQKLCRQWGAVAFEIRHHRGRMCGKDIFRLFGTVN